MSKGLKIYKAQLISTGQEVGLHNFEESLRPDIKCTDCNAKLKYTKGHRRNEKVVYSFFSLFPKAVHSDQCAYNVRSALEILVRNSTSIDSLSEATLFKGNFGLEFRLHTLSNVLFEKPEEKEEGTINQQSLIRKQSKQRLSSYLKTAKGLAKLWNAIQEQEDKELLKEKIKIVFKQQLIGWDDFVFNTKQLSKLTSNPPKFPVALVLHTKQFNNNKKQGFFKHSLQCFAHVTNDKVIVPRICFNDDKLKSELKEGGLYLVIAIVKVGKIYKESKYINITVSVYHNAQITMLSDERIVP
jgi:hypothetical protein